jgi:hypothetical protein
MAGNDRWRPRDYLSLSDLDAELDRFEAAHQAGSLQTTGNWSAGQILEHCAQPVDFAIDGWVNQDGTPITFPFFLRVIGSVLIKPTLGRIRARPGIKLPKQASRLLPQPERSFEDGMRMFRESMTRLHAGEQMTQRSPLLGNMTHEKWLKLHLDHCRLHFGFIQCDTVGA